MQDVQSKHAWTNKTIHTNLLAIRIITTLGLGNEFKSRMEYEDTMTHVRDNTKMMSVSNILTILLVMKLETTTHSSIL